MNFWRRYREGEQKILPQEKRKVVKKTELVEEQKIEAVLEEKRLERLERKRRAEHMWLEVLFFTAALLYLGSVSLW